MSPPTAATRPSYAADAPDNEDSSRLSASNPLKRPRSSTSSHDLQNLDNAGDRAARDERRQGLMRDLYARSERLVASVVYGKRDASKRCNRSPSHSLRDQPSPDPVLKPSLPQTSISRRNIDEDDYGDEDDDDEAEDIEKDAGNAIERSQHNQSSQARSHPISQVNHISDRGNASPLKPPLDRTDTLTAAQSHGATSEDARKKLEQEKKASEDAVKESFQAMFYTLENDRDAMVEQQKLDELDRQVENEMSTSNDAGPGPETHGTLSTTNLGASSLTLKHLFATIDANRGKVKATDARLRSLISEVRKNRSKWASEERVGQEELYEAAERVLMELKSMTEYAGPFLTKVKRTDAPDYHKVIKEPMDLGTMMKKLSKGGYDSKKDFCRDLGLIWENCLAFNTRPDHPFRKKAIHMQKETARLVPLIPEITIRDRKDVEREEQQLEQLENADDDSDEDDRPIAATRGRKAPAKSSKSSGQNRKAPAASPNGTDEDTKAKSGLQGLRQEQLKTDTDSVEGSQLGFSTPPPGNATPMGASGMPGSVAPPSNGDPSEIDGLNASTMGVLQAEEPEEEDDEYRIWKRVTKKDRARIASERHRLFLNDRINSEEPALLRTRRVMRRWLKQQQVQADMEPGDDALQESHAVSEPAEGAMLADEINKDEENTLPDYYDPLAAVPPVSDRLQWITDADGQTLDQREDCLRLMPQGRFLPPPSELSFKVDQNIHQMQETRKIVAKISIVKQMQLQSQTYQNQFQKYAPEPFLEADVEPMVTSDDGPLMHPTLARAALQRSVGKLLYAAGFEDFQPSALEVATDVAGDFFCKLVKTVQLYSEVPDLSDIAQSNPGSQSHLSRPHFTPEEVILHTLHQNGQDLNDLEAYCTETCATLPPKLEAQHGRIRDYYAELLRPALDPTSVGNDGVGAFQDGNEAQFVAGDFAEDIGEDFFGFKELGLDREFGLAGLSVPLHLLQSRISNMHQQADPNAIASSGTLMKQPPPYQPVTADSLTSEIGLIHEYFQERLAKSADGQGPLIEDEELPAKQRFPKPRLPPNGKISSPRKRPLREQQMLARKRKRAEIEAQRQRENGNRDVSAAIGTGVDAVSGADGTVEESADAEEPAKKAQKTVNGSSVNVGSSNNDLQDPLANGDNDSRPLSKLKLNPASKDKSLPEGDPQKKQRPSKADSAGNKNNSSNDEAQDEPNGVLSPNLIAAH